MMLLASCQDVVEETAQSGVATAEPGYPSLHTVPARPQLSYTVEQRRTIVDGLIADRENARYTDGVVRYRTGLTSIPPPAPPVFTAAPVETEPGTPEAADAAGPAVAARDRPVVTPETEFVYEDDDLGSFMEDMVVDGIERSGEAAPRPAGEPEANAAPLGSSIIRASAARPVAAAASYAGRAPGVVWGIPPETASLPDEPMQDAAALPANDDARRAPPAPAPARPALAPPIETVRASRAPAVVWGTPDVAKAPAELTSGTTVTSAIEISTALRAMPPEPTPAKPVLALPRERTNGREQPAELIETARAGRAPAVVWAIPVAMAQPPTESTLDATATRASDPAASRLAAPEPAPVKPVFAAPIEMVDGNAQRVAPIETARTDRSIPQPLLKPATGAAGIEVADGLVAIEVASAENHDIALGSIAFGPGSATLPPDAGLRLQQLLAEAKASDARIKIVGEAAAPALALDRARAVGLALVRSGMPADRLELTLARGASGDQARLFLAAPAP